jgi:DNA-binding FrmR family transcriptional regulator
VAKRDKGNGAQATAASYLDEESKRALVNRLSRLEGHVGAIKRMVEEARCADEILIQVAAARAALTQTAVVLLEQHLSVCVTTCMEGSEDEIAKRVSKAVALVLKQS